jgi:hypothetical protein
MRQAFLAAAAAWCVCLLAAIMTSIFNSPIYVVASLTIAALLTGLWVTHLIAFGFRVALRATAVTTGIVRAGGPDVEQDSARRSFLGIMAKAVGGMTLATIFPGGPAYAYGNCSDPNYVPCPGARFCVPPGSLNACCPASKPYLSACDCLCYEDAGPVFGGCPTHERCG